MANFEHLENALNLTSVSTPLSNQNPSQVLFILLFDFLKLSHLGEIIGDMCCVSQLQYKFLVYISLHSPPKSTIL